ncbi:MAG: MFS transporter, partial [Pseudomonadota bacterium]
DRFGGVRVTQASLVIGAASLVCLAGGALWLAALSALLGGIAFGPCNPASSTVLAAVTPANKRGLVFSIKQTAVPIGGALAGVVIVGIATQFGWRAAAFSGAVACLALAVALQPVRGRFDAPNVQAGRKPARISRTFGVIVATPALRPIAVLAGCFAGVQFAVGAIFVAYLVDVATLSVSVAGGLLAAAMGLSVALRIALGVATDRFGGLRVLSAVAAAMALAALVCAVAGQAAAAAAMVALAACAYGWNGVFLAEVARIAPADAIARATAACMMVVFLGGVVGPSAFVGLTKYAAGFALAFAVLGVIAAFGSVVAFAADRAERRALVGPQSTRP